MNDSNTEVYNDLIHKFHKNLMKSSKLYCHVLFLTCCLNFGLPPNGLTIKFPMSGLPPYMHNEINLLAMKTSLTLTRTVLDLYKKQLNHHNQEMTNLKNVILTAWPSKFKTIEDMHVNAQHFMSNKAQNLLKKLSNICQHAFRLGINLPTQFSEHESNFKNSSISNPPCLADLYNLPKPPRNKNIPPPMQKPNKLTCNATNTNKCNYINISNYKLNSGEEKVIEKGLSFAPTPKFDHFNLVSDTLQFARNVRRKYFFDKENPVNNKLEEIDSSLLKFKANSDWDPPPLNPDHPVEQFLNVIIANVSDYNFPNSLPKSKNLMPEEIKCITRLRNNKEIIILPADKGDVTVIMNMSDYLLEARRQLEDTTTYKLLDSDKTLEIQTTIKKFVTENGHTEGLSNNSIDLLLPKFPKTPVFYLLPKIHKNITPPPGRPIVSSIYSPTERISAFVDKILQSFVKTIPSFIKNSNHFLEKLQNLKQPLPNNTLLVTVDVTSLYTNIEHKQGMEAVKYFLNDRPSNELPSTSFITNLINFILTMNCFRFQNSYYLQLKGTAMGTRMAPSYANLFMARYEIDFLETQVLQPFAWFRFIDDIFILWNHGMDSLTNFLDALNNFGNLKFTWTISNTNITFLDVDIFLDKGFIKHKIHTKETNTFQYLHYQSCHPNYIKKNIPKSLATRASILCSENEDFQNYIDKISKSFIDRQYPKKLINEKLLQFKKHPNKLNSTQKTSFVNTDPKFITQYSPGLHKINNILKIAFKTLQNSSVSNQLFKSVPRIIFKKPPTLKDILVHPKLPEDDSINSKDKHIGCHPCNIKRCKVCNMLEPADTFKSSTTGTTYKISSDLSCQSSNIVYQIQCQNCPKDYIGSTINSLRTRMTGHRFSYNHSELEKPLVAHAFEHDTSFENLYKVKPIRQLQQNSSVSDLRNYEQSYQLVTKSKHPSGLNLR